MKIEFTWDSKEAGKRPNARMFRMWGVNGKRIEALCVYRIAGRLHYKPYRSDRRTLQVLNERSYDAVFTTHAEASEMVNPGKRRKGWFINWRDEVQECRVAPDGTVYNMEGVRVGRESRRDIYKTQRAAAKVLAEMFQKRADISAKEARSYRAQARQLLKKRAA
jgi:hypothetical protein